MNPKRKSFRPRPLNDGQPVARVLAFQNNKGGSAKTTTVAVMAFLLAKEGKRVLVVDLDPQKNLTQMVGFDAERHEFNGDVFQGIHQWAAKWEATAMHQQVVGLKYKNLGMPLYLVPGTHEMGAAEAVLTACAEQDPEVGLRLRKSLDTLRPYFDYIFIDTTPNIQNNATTLTLMAADAVVVPIDGFQAVHGMLRVLRKMRAIHDERVRRGFGPIQLFMCCPHFLADDNTTPPYGPDGVRNNTWYPLLHTAFPNHFITPVVGHNSISQKSYRVGRYTPTSHAGPQYKKLYKALFRAITGPAIPCMSQQIADGAFDLDALFTDIESMRKEKEDEIIVAKARFRARSTVVEAAKVAKEIPKEAKAAVVPSSAPQAAPVTAAAP